MPADNHFFIKWLFFSKRNQLMASFEGTYVGTLPKWASLDLVLFHHDTLICRYSLPIWIVRLIETRTIIDLIGLGLAFQKPLFVVVFFYKKAFAPLGSSFLFTRGRSFPYSVKLLDSSIFAQAQQRAQETKVGSSAPGHIKGVAPKGQAP